MRYKASRWTWPLVTLLGSPLSSCTTTSDDPLSCESPVPDETSTPPRDTTTPAALTDTPTPVPTEVTPPPDIGVTPLPTPEPYSNATPTPPPVPATTPTPSPIRGNPPTPTPWNEPTPEVTPEPTPEVTPYTPTPQEEESQDPWDDPDYWLASSTLDLVFDMDQAPDEAHYEVVMCRSTVGYGIRMECTTIAHTFSTLDVFVYSTGLILLGGLNMVDFNYLQYGGDYLYAITTPDLEQFGTHMWYVENTASPFLTDASLEQLPDGTIRAVYYSGMAGYVGSHAIRAAYRDGETWVEAPDPIYVEDNLLDPKTCRYNGTYYLFATKNSTSIIQATGIDPYHYVGTPDFSWTETQVPFCLENEGEFWLVGQAGGGWGPPLYRVLLPGGTYTDPVTLWAQDQYPELESCTSPVLAEFHDEYVVFCAVHR